MHFASASHRVIAHVANGSGPTVGSAPLAHQHLKKQGPDHDFHMHDHIMTFLLDPAETHSTPLSTGAKPLKKEGRMRL